LEFVLKLRIQLGNVAQGFVYSILFAMAVGAIPVKFVKQHVCACGKIIENSLLVLLGAFNPLDTLTDIHII
jgi:hypothetical protein